MLKAPVATIKLDAFREGNQVVIRIADDGAGLNFRAIRAAAGRMQRDDELVVIGEKEWGTNPKAILKYLVLRYGAFLI